MSKRTPAQRRRAASRKANHQGSGGMKPLTEGGDPRYPINNKGQLHDAMQALGRAKPGDKAAVKTHIASRAKTLGLTSELTDTYKDAGEPDASEPDDGMVMVPDGVMVALRVPADLAATLAVPATDGLVVVPAEEMHVTLACIDVDPTQLSDDGTNALEALTARFSTSESALTGEIVGPGIFYGDDSDHCCAVAMVEADGLDWAHDRIVDSISAAGGTVKDHDTYNPHITLAYGPVEQLADLPFPNPGPVTFDTVGLTIAGETTEYPMYGPGYYYEAPSLVMRSIVKADDQRYTLAPLYVPEVDDSHGEYVSGGDLEKAAWDYVAAGDFDIRLQHSEVVIGKCVGILTLPFEAPVTLTKADGSTTETTLPAGTVYQGIVWNDVGWDLVKSGHLNGLSLGGNAFKIEADA